MSNYFKKFPKVLYLFGDEITPVAFQNLSKSSNYIKNISDEISTYIEYEIKDFERPDSLSQQLYGTSEYDWTFFMMNDPIMEQGWPLALQDLYQLSTTELHKDWTCKIEYEYYTADSVSKSISTKYPVGQTVSVNGKSLIVKSKNLQFGEISVYSPNYSVDSDFTAAGGLISYTDSDNVVIENNLVSTVKESFGTYEYRNSQGDPIDYLYFPLYNEQGEDTQVVVTPKIAITNLTKLIEDNDKLKKIRIIKKELIGNVVGKYKSILGNQ